MSTTVSVPGGVEVTSNYESAESMVEALSPDKGADRTPRVLMDKGEVVPEKDETSQAASVLGKKGGQAAAKARAEAAKAKPAEKEAKPSEETTEDEVTEAKGKTEGDEEKPLGKPRDDPKARIAVLARERREAEERADRAERELESVRRQREAPAPAREERREAKPADNPEPSLAQYDGPDAYERWVKDTIDYKAEQKFSEREQKAHHERQSYERTRGVLETFKGFSDRMAEATKADPELVNAAADLGLYTSVIVTKNERGHPVATQIENVGPKNIIADVVVQSEIGPRILRHLVDNPDEIQRIAALGGPTEIQLGMARLEGRLERSDAVTADTSSEPEVSRARPPARSVAGAPHIVGGDTGELSDDAPLSSFVRNFGQRQLRAR